VNLYRDVHSEQAIVEHLASNGGLCAEGKTHGVAAGGRIAGCVA